MTDIEKKASELTRKLERNKEFAVVEVIEHLEKENAELKSQIEKMKCCGNCGKTRTCSNSIKCQSENYSEWEIYDV